MSTHVTINRRKLLKGTTLAIGAGFIPSLPAYAKGGNAYKNKTLTIAVGSAPGGGYDAYARLLGRHIGRFIAGEPNVIVQNRDGASGIVATNYVGVQAPRDGTMIGIAQRAVFVEPLFGNRALAVDPRTLSWIGSLNTEWSVGVTWHTSGFTRLEEALSREVIAASQGPTSDDSIYPSVINSILGTRFRIVSGYKGKAEERLALERGEAQAMVGWAWSAAKATAWDQITSGQLRVFLFLAPEKRPGFEHVPTIYDYARNDTDRQVFDFIFGAQILGRPFFAPPDVPADRLAILRSAFEQTVKDREFLADAEQVKLDLDPVSADVLEQRLGSLYTAAPEIVELAKSARGLQRS